MRNTTAPKNMLLKGKCLGEGFGFLLILMGVLILSQMEPGEDYLSKRQACSLLCGDGYGGVVTLEGRQYYEQIQINSVSPGVKPNQNYSDI